MHNKASFRIEINKPKWQVSTIAKQIIYKTQANIIQLELKKKNKLVDVGKEFDKSGKY